MNNDEPQSLQNLWAADLFPNLYSERLSEPWDMTVADRGWWTEGLSAEVRMPRYEVGHTHDVSILGTD